MLTACVSVPSADVSAPLQAASVNSMTTAIIIAIRFLIFLFPFLAQLKTALSDYFDPSAEFSKKEPPS